MDVEFTIDDFGEIFFQYADNIYCRYEKLVTRKPQLYMKDKLMGKFVSHKEENLGKKVEDMKDFIKKPKA